MKCYYYQLQGASLGACLSMSVVILAACLLVLISGLRLFCSIYKNYYYNSHTLQLILMLFSMIVLSSFFVVFEFYPILFFLNIGSDSSQSFALFINFINKQKTLSGMCCLFSARSTFSRTSSRYLDTRYRFQ